MPRIGVLGRLRNLLPSRDCRPRNGRARCRNKGLARRQMAVETLEDRRLLSIQPVSAVHPTLAGDTAGGLDEGAWTWTSDDGRWVAFTSDAPNLVAGQVDARRADSSNWNADVFLHDKQLGTKTLVSRQDGTTAATANGMSVAMGISSDGRYVLFRSDAINLLPGQADTNAGFDIFLYDGVNRSVQLVSHSSDPAQKTVGNQASTAAVLSADGSFVAFESNAANLVAGQIDANNASDVFLWQRSTGAITLVSHLDGSAATTGSNGSRSPSISSDGRSVAFASDATNLVAGAADANGAGDVFLFDYVSRTNSLVSHDASAPLNSAAGVSGNPAISGDGQYVAYESLANNLVAGQSDGIAATDVFLFSRADGASQLVSAAGGSGTTAGGAASTSPAVSSDGRYVAFVSDALNLVAGQSDGNGGSDVFLFDRGAGPGGPSSIRLVSHYSGSTTTAANGTSGNLSLSDDGRWVAYSSLGGDLVSGQGEGNNREDVFLYDRNLGTSVLVSREGSTAVLTGDGASLFPVVSGSGSAVVYLTDATNLVAGKRDDNLFPDLVLFENDATPENLLVTLRDPGLPSATGNSVSFVTPGTGQAVASADGRFVVFSSEAKNLVAGQVQVAQRNVFLFDALTGQAQLVSHSFESATETGDDNSEFPTISADGRYVAFVSYASNLIQSPIDMNGEPDVFLFDRITGTTRLVSHAPGSSTTTGNRASDSPAISGDGRFIAFASMADDLVSGVTDANFAADIFLYDLANESVRLISASSGSASTAANAGSSDPAISADGSRVLFLSQATNLVSGQTVGTSGQDAFLFDGAGGLKMVSRVAGSAAAAGDGPVRRAVLSTDGQYVAFESFASNLIVGGSDANGDFDIFLYRVADSALALVSHAASSLLTAANGPSSGPALSANGRYLAFASSAANLVNGQIETDSFSDVFLYDRVGGSTQLVSHASGSVLTAGDGASDAPAISADGRFVAFSSTAGNLVGGMVDGNATAPDVFRFDRMAGANQLVSRTPAASPTTGDSWSQLPGISADGRSVVFNSDASNLVAGDYNRVADVYLFRAGGLINAAPSLNPSVATSLGAIDEDVLDQANSGTAVDSLVATLGLYADAQGVPPAGIAAIGQDTTNGAWQYSTDAMQWTPLGPVSDSSATLLAADGAGRNRIRFVPHANYNGSASFAFRAWDTSDGRLNGSTGVSVASNGGLTAYSSQFETAAITIRAVNDAPQAADDPGYEVMQKQSLGVSAAQGVLKNDSDIEGGSLTAAKVTDPQHGTLVLNPDGSFTYTPEQTFYGVDSFTYRASDGSDSSNVATVTITVRSLNQAPVVVDHEYRTVKDRLLQVPAQNGLLAGATDQDGDPLTAAVVGAPPTGLAVSSDGSFTYTPPTGFVGTVTFSYVANDGKVNSQPATVTLNVLQYDPDPVVNGPATGASMVLRLSSGNVVLLSGSKVLFTQPLGSLNSLRVVGANNKADTLSADFNLGGAFTLPGGIAFDGGNGTTSDTLVLRGTAGPDTFKALLDHLELGGSTFQYVGAESVRFEGLGGNDTYVVSALPRPLSISDTAGVDALDFSDAAAGVIVNLASTSAQKIFGTTATLTLKGGFENLTWTVDSDRLTGNSAANKIWALAGNDTVYGGDGNDTIYGGDGNDTLNGGNGKDLIFGEAGEDVLFGNAGNNVLVGGGGDDKLNAGSGRNVLIGGAGQDNLKGASADDILIGGATLYDESPEELLAILAEWSSTARPAAKRVSNLTQGIAGPKGRTINLARNSGVIDDSAADTLYGGPASDWYLSFGQDIFVDTPGRSDFT